jgi:restriction system protein
MSEISSSLVAWFRSQLDGVIRLKTADHSPLSNAKAALYSHDALWRDVITGLEGGIANSPSEAWTGNLRGLHRQREVRYQQSRAVLVTKIEGLQPTHVDLGLYERAIEKAGDVIEKELQRFENRLSIKRRQLEIRNEYGGTDAKRWIAEIQKFVRENPAVRVAVMELASVDTTLEIGFDWASAVCGLIDARISAGPDDGMPPIGDGLALEQSAAAALSSEGWEVNTTPVTGDQGVDLVARREDFTIVLQCKNTSQPVGNSAVQEVFAGRAFYDADAAAVVAQNGFTVSARQLAGRLSVHLLDLSELRCFEPQFKSNPLPKRRANDKPSSAA